MNEEQSDRLLNILDDIKNYMKEKQVIKEVVVEKRFVKKYPLSVERLIKFKELIISNDFFNSLTNEQKDKIIKLNTIKDRE